MAAAEAVAAAAAVILPSRLPLGEGGSEEGKRREGGGE